MRIFMSKESLIWSAPVKSDLLLSLVMIKCCATKLTLWNCLSAVKTGIKKSRHAKLLTESFNQFLSSTHLK